jgi:hypothetical protein
MQSHEHNINCQNGALRMSKIINPRQTSRLIGKTRTLTQYKMNISS